MRSGVLSPDMYSAAAIPAHMTAGLLPNWVQLQAS